MIRNEQPINSAEYLEILRIAKLDEDLLLKTDLSSFQSEEIYVLFNESWKSLYPLPINILERIKIKKDNPENLERLEVSLIV